MPSGPEQPAPPRHPANVRAARRALFPEEAEPLLERLREILCEPTRANIMRALTTTRLTVGDLARVIDRSDSSTSRHLRVLRELGVVRSRRSGRLVYNGLTEGPLADATRQVLDTLAAVAVPSEEFPVRKSLRSSSGPARAPRFSAGGGRCDLSRTASRSSVAGRSPEA